MLICLRGISRSIRALTRGLPAGLALLALLVLPACRPETPEAHPRQDNLPLPEEILVVDTAGKTGGTLCYPMAGEPSSFNFVNTADARTHLITTLLNGTLLEFDRKKQQVSAGLMKEWKLSDDASSIILKLRRGLRFSDGVPVTADDIVYTMQKIYEEGTSNVLRNNLTVLGRQLKAEKIDERTARIIFPGPYAGAEYILTTIPILPRHRLSDPSRLIEDYWGLNTPPEEVVGLGPFVLAEHQPGRRTVLRYNPYYWRIDYAGNRLPYLDEIVIVYIADRNSQVLRFQAGELDLLDAQLRPDDFIQIQKSGGEFQTFNAGASNNLTFCWLNQNSGTDPASGKPYLSPEKRSWFLDLNFRKAFGRAISREAVVRNAFLGLARPAWTMVPESIPAWHAADLPKYDQDLELARDLLRSSGFSWRKEATQEVLVDSDGRVVRFSLFVRSDDFWGRVAAILQQDLEKIGMQVSIRPEEFRSLISRIEHSRDYDAMLQSIDIPYDPADHSILFSSSPMHFWDPGQAVPATEWEKRVDQLMLEQMKVIDFTKRQAIYHEIQRTIFEQSPLFPLVNKDVLVAAGKRVKNLRPANISPHSLWNSWEIWVE